jgi:hypothetical protein
MADNTYIPDTPRNRGNYEALHMSSVTPSEDIRSIMINRVAWGPVFAGVAMALVTQLILNLFGIGLGVATLTPETANNWAVANLSLGTAIWWTVSGILAAYIGGYTAGRLSGEPRESSAGWHGLTSWAASILILVSLIMAGSGVVMGGALNTAGFNTAGAASAKGQQANNPPNNSATAEMSAQTLAQTEGIPLDEARLRVQQQTSPSGAANTGTETPDTTTGATVTTNNTTVSKAALSRIVNQGALLSAVALLFGALAAWLGGRSGTVKPTITTNKTYMH